MLVYNTTYSMPEGDARNFVIWVKQSYMPQVEADGALSEGRLLRILNHHDQETECFGLQFTVADSSTLHQWFVRQGKALADEVVKLFDGRVVGFSTLMEVIDD